MSFWVNCLLMVGIHLYALDVCAQTITNEQATSNESRNALVQVYVCDESGCPAQPTTVGCAECPTADDLSACVAEKNGLEARVLELEARPECPDTGTGSTDLEACRAANLQMNDRLVEKDMEIARLSGELTQAQNRIRDLESQLAGAPTRSGTAGDCDEDWDGNGIIGSPDYSLVYQNVSTYNNIARSVIGNFGRTCASKITVGTSVPSACEEDPNRTGVVDAADVTALTIRYNDATRAYTSAQANLGKSCAEIVR